ncbi:histidine phosphatase family protein [Mycolicibacterium canariasense]|nr:histidine phosphatase family protein [Mycolicibacterium canariasense]ORV05416.1 phosphoglycerate kinase [Mycolicibacterium canariasense]
MRTLSVVVHPEATHHVEGVVGGWHDSSLTERGARDAAAIAEAVSADVPAGESVVVVTSDLRRASETAEAICSALGVSAIVDRRLREKSYGAADGRPQAWLEERFVPPPPEGDRMGHDEGIVGSESKREFATRVYAAVEDLLGRQASHCVVVTHGFALTFVVSAFMRLPIDGLGYVNFRSRPGGITVLCEDDEFHNRQLVRLSDIAHLQALRNP